MRDTPAVQRLSALQERQAKISDELHEIQEGNEPDKIITPNGEFDNSGWLLAEAQDTDAESMELMKTMNAQGDIPYETGHQQEI